MIYTLSNRNGGFTPITEKQYYAWKVDPARAVAEDFDLRDHLAQQTLNQGYNYADFTAHKIVK